jgi:rod shape determining protein RodA
LRRGSFFNIDIYILTSTIILLFIGVLFIFSSNTSIINDSNTNEYIKQIVWILIGIPILVFFSLYNYQNFKNIAHFIYITAILLLIVTRILGEEVNGAISWLRFGGFIGIQSSEFAKVAVILFFGAYLSTIGSKIRQLPYFLVGLLICLAPMMLVVIQPDLGTAAVYIPIFLAMAWAAGAKKRHIVFIVLSGIFMISIFIIPYLMKYFPSLKNPLLLIFTQSEYILAFMGILSVIVILSAIGYYFLKTRYFYWIYYSGFILIAASLGALAMQYIIKLKEKQIKRLIIFLDPQIDPKGDGWNIIESVMAIGSGGLTGKGFRMGILSQSQYIPQQSTDFIYSIISEEWGFIGGLFILILFLIILTRGMKIIYNSRDSFAHYIGAGIIGMIFFHVIINIGMTMGIMPITGIPLFFISYGGSSLITGLIAIGILLNIHYRRYS